MRSRQMPCRKIKVVFLELCSSRVAVLTLQKLKVPIVGELTTMLKEKDNLFEVLYGWFLAKVGCPLRCSFCATGKGVFARNLRSHEIVEQVLAIEEVFNRRVTSIYGYGRANVKSEGST